MKRSEGERIRARAVIERLRACIKGIEIALDDKETPIGNEAGQAVTQTAIEISVLLAKIDAYQRSEQDQRSTVQIPTESELDARRAALVHPFKPGTAIINPRGIRNALSASEAYLNQATCKCEEPSPDPENRFLCLECGLLMKPGTIQASQRTMG